MNMQEDVVPQAADDAGDLPFSDIRVLEFCHTIMGPSCGVALADLGADVIKIEPAPMGDRTRVLKGFVAGTFAYLNRNKRSIGIDLKSEAGRALVHRMVKEADVVIENYGPGTAERIGIGYEELSAINPRLVYCSLKGFLPGPYENRPALDEVVQYMAGLAYMTGPPGQPLRAGASVVDLLGGIFGAYAVVAALRRRERTGVGEKVQSALFETTAFLVGQHMAGEAITGHPPLPMPLRSRSWAIYETFVASDGKPVFVGITSNRHWKAFCVAFGRDDLLSDERYDTNEKRLAAHDVLRQTLSDIMGQFDSEELMRRLVDHGIPAAPVAKPGDLFDDPQLNYRDRLLNVRLSNGSSVKLPRLPIAIDDLDLGLRMQPPLLGEHTMEIGTRYGLSEQEVKSLIAEGVLA